jgi:hypothetical protein
MYCLRKLINTEFPEDPSRFEQSGVIFAGVNAASGMFAVLFHGAELDHREFSSAETEPLLTEKDRSGIFDIYGGTRKQDQPPEAKQNENSAENIPCPLKKISVHTYIHPDVIPENLYKPV